MKVKLLSIGLSSLLFVALNVAAHDPKEHMKDGEKPQCDAMKDMDMAKMDEKDPVVQAMMKKCNEQLHPREERMADHMAAHGDSHMGDSHMQDHMNHQSGEHGKESSAAQHEPATQSDAKSTDEHQDHH